MKDWLHFIWNGLKVCILFTSCTVLFYYGILWLSAEYESYHRYDEPQGRAVKVVEIFEEDNRPLWLERLIYFYRHGE